MKTKMTPKRSLKALASLLLAIAPMTMFAQFNRTTYFMDGVSFKQKLNPALAPSRGFVNIPGLGAFNMGISSNSISSYYLSDILNNSSSADYFTTDKFINQLKENNRLNMSVATDLASVGWWGGDGFWNVNLSLKLDVDANVKRDVFEFMRAAHGLSNQSWVNANLHTSGLQANINSYMEAGVGYTRPFGDRLVLGAKVKLLFGIADINMKVDEITMKTNLHNIAANQDWSTITEEQLQKVTGKAIIKARAEVKGSMAGLSFVTDNNKYVDNIEHSGGGGLAGFGAAVDLGAAYKLGRDFTLSAALLDLGFISWGQGSTIHGVSDFNREYDFDGVHAGQHRQEFRKTIESGEIFNSDLWNLKAQESKSRTTSLRTTMVLGAQYKLLNDKLTVGALSTTRLGEVNTQSELTLAGNYSFNSHIGIALSYSMLQSQGKGLGLGFKLGPVTLATDYMYFGQDTRTVSGMIGISIPLGSRR